MKVSTAAPKVRPEVHYHFLEIGSWQQHPIAAVSLISLFSKSGRDGLYYKGSTRYIASRPPLLNTYACLRSLFW